MRVATWNVNSLRVRLQQVIRWSELSGVDVLCLQETKTIDSKFPLKALQEAGFEHVVFTGQPTYNGVAILSRFPLTDVQFGFTGDDDPQKRVVMATVKGVRVIGVYTPNGKSVSHPDYRYKLGWLKKLKAEVEAVSGPLLLCGDMNIAPDDLDVWDPFRFNGTLLCSQPERDALQEIMDVGLTDAFRAQERFSTAFTWWDYRNLGFSRNQGLRIDHIFVTDDLLKVAGEVINHRDCRGWEQPSDHIPVSIDLNLS